MATREPWESRPDNQLAKGVGVLIDTDYLCSTEKNYHDNPYYLVVKGIRYYGPTPEKVVEAVRMKIPDTLKIGIPPVAMKQVATAIPSGRTVGSRARNAASAAAQGAKGAFTAAGTGMKAIGAKVGQFFTRKAKTPGPLPGEGQSTPIPKANPGEENTVPLLSEAATRGGRRRTRRTRKSLRKSLRFSAHA